MEKIKDMIYRQAAIEALHDEIVRRRISEDTNDDGSLDEFDTEAILRQLPSAQPEQRWIPCSERLPEDSVYVLLTVRRMDDSYNHVPFISTGYISWNHQCWWCAHDGNCKDANIDVIAWMPLPEPYEEDPCNGCGYLGESCVGEGCGKLT